MTTTQRTLNEAVKNLLNTNDTAQLTSPVVVSLQCHNGFDYDTNQHTYIMRDFTINEVARTGKAGVVEFSDGINGIRISELSDASCKALLNALPS